MTLKEARTKRQLTQEELAAVSGVTQPTISAIERGEVAAPTWSTVAKLSKALKMKPEDLFPVGVAS